MHVSECIAMQMNLMAVPVGCQWMHRGCCSDVSDKSEWLIRVRLHAPVKICKHSRGSQSELGSDPRCSPPQLTRHKATPASLTGALQSPWSVMVPASAPMCLFLFMFYWLLFVCLCCSCFRRQWLKKTSRLNFIKLFEEVESAQGRQALPLILQSSDFCRRGDTSSRNLKKSSWFSFQAPYTIFILWLITHMFVGKSSLYSVSGADLLHWSIIDMIHCSASRTLLLSAAKSTFLNIFLLPQWPRPLITQNAAVLASIIQSRTFRFIRPVGIRLPLICCQTSDQRVVGIERWAVWLFPLIWPWAATCAEVSSLQIPDVSRPLWCVHRWKPRRIFSNNLEGKESILLSDWLFIRPWCQS